MMDKTTGGARAAVDETAPCFISWCVEPCLGSRWRPPVTPPPSSREVMSSTPMSHHRQRLTKVSVIGARNVGMAVAQTILTRDDLADEMALVDALPDAHRGEMLDLQHAAAFLPRTRTHTHLVADTDMSVTRGSDLAIVTAGARQIPGETMLNLLQRNVALVHKIVPALAEHSLDAILLIVSNPVDVRTLSYVAWKLSGFPASRVIGSGTNLDLSRLLAEHLDVNAYMVGEHSDSSVAWMPVLKSLQESHSSFDEEALEGIRRAVVDSAYEANGPFVGANFSDGQIRAQEHRWPRTGGTLGYTGRPTEHNWSRYLVQAIQQQVPGTCALAAVVACVEPVHRIESVHLHGGVGFPSQLCMAAALRRLFVRCVTDDTWGPRRGAQVGAVLNKVIQMGGLRATNMLTMEEHVLPVRSWEMHCWSDDDSQAGRGLSAERVAELLRPRVPRIGIIWVVSPWYRSIDADTDGEQVYHTGGCGRSEQARVVSGNIFPGQVGWHAVVCYDYRWRGGHMHVLILDNHTPSGPRRWIHVDELYAIFTVTSLGLGALYS